MQLGKSAVERAFELARSGRFETTKSIIRQLRDDGYSGDPLYGPTLLKQLRAAIREATRDKNKR